MKRHIAFLALAVALSPIPCSAGSDAEGNWVGQAYNLSLVSADTTFLTLQWNAPEAQNYYEGYYGAAERYELRQSSSYPGSFDSMTPSTAELPRPDAPWTLQSGVVSGLEPVTPYWFVLRSWKGNAHEDSYPLQAATINDLVAPAQVGGLTVDATTSHSVRLSWPATGDDGATGMPRRYQLRYSTIGPVASNAEFANASPVTPDPAAHYAGGGGRETATVEGLLPTTSYWFAVRAVDEVGNVGAVGGASPTATTLAEEDKGGDAGGPSCGGRAAARRSPGIGLPVLLSILLLGRLICR